MADNIMFQVDKEAKRKTSEKELKLIWIFFIFGFALGILLSSFWISHEREMLGFRVSDYKLYIQIFCASVILILFEKIYSYTLSVKKRRYLHEIFL